MWKTTSSPEYSATKPALLPVTIRWRCKHVTVVTQACCPYAFIFLLLNSPCNRIHKMLSSSSFLSCQKKKSVMDLNVTWRFRCHAEFVTKFFVRLGVHVSTFVSASGYSYSEKTSLSLSVIWYVYKRSNEAYMKITSYLLCNKIALYTTAVIIPTDLLSLCFSGECPLLCHLIKLSCNIWTNKYSD